MPVVMLSGVRVLDATFGQAAFCGHILYELGAEVIKLEPAVGGPGRSITPFGDDASSSGLLARYLNRGKRSVALDLSDPAGRQELLRLLADVDIFLESFSPGYLLDTGLGRERLEREVPHLVHTSITPFGQTGPHARLRTTDLVSLALAGALHGQGEEGRPPHRFSVDQAQLIAAAEATVGTLAALLAGSRQSFGRGQHVDVAVHDTLVSIFARGQIAHWHAAHAAVARSGAPAARAAGIPPRRSTYRTADGYVNFQILGGANNHYVQRVADWMREEGWSNGATAFDWNRYQYGVLNAEELAAMEDDFEAFFMIKTTDELAERNVRQGLLIFPINSPTRVLRMPPLVESGYFVALPCERGPVPAPGRFFFSSRLDWTEWTDAAAAPPSSRPPSPASARAGNSAPSADPGASLRGALAGVRVIDLTWVVAGPAVSRYFAACGAEVIKVEGRSRPDALRITPPLVGGTRLDSGLAYDQANAGKKSVALNLKEAEARRLVLQLIAQADVVVDNYAGGVMERLGFDYERVRQLRPDIIMLSLNLFGHGNSWAAVPGFGMGLAAATGFAWLSGWPDRPPSTAGAYTDSVVPPLAATLVLAALAHRDRTGEGQALDLSQCGGGALFLAAPLLDAAATGEDWLRIGNRSRTAAPHGIYPTGTPGRWCAIAVEDDAPWAALKEVLERPAWAEDERFATAAGRLAHQDELDELIAAWTRSRELNLLEQQLRGAGVPAGAVRLPEELAADPQLHHRHFFEDATHPAIGDVVQLKPGFALSGTPVEFGRGPLLGEHNRDVLGDLLGLSANVLEALAVRGVTE